MARTTRAVVGLLPALLISGCVFNTTVDPMPEPLREPQENIAAETPVADNKGKTEKAETPQIQFVGQRIVGPSYVDVTSATSLDNVSGAPISVNIHNMPLFAFINEVFGNRLGLSFSLSPSLKNKNDLVTLRVEEALEPAEFYAASQQILAEYGVEIVQQDGLLLFREGQAISNDAMPLLVSGRALPEVPLSHRTVFQIVPLSVVGTSNAKKWLAELLPKNDVKVLDDPLTSSIILSGTSDSVKQGLSALKILDRPVLRSRYSMVITPLFSSAKEMSSALQEVMKSEGYEVSGKAPFGNMIVLELGAFNKVAVFASSRKALDRVRFWVGILDRQSQEAVEDGYFTYQIENVQATVVAEVLSSLGYSASSVSAGSTTGSSSLSDSNNSESKTSTPAKTKTISSGGSGDKGRIVVDQNRNAIIFNGSGKQWLQLKPLLIELDKPVPSVLIDVLLAEVTLTDETSIGVDWRAIGTIGGGRQISFGSNPGVTAGKGLNLLLLNSAGDTRATINAFYDNDKAVIRSSPKLMVRSGEEAVIEVGNEIPIVTGTSQSTDNVNSPITTTVQYRKTGALLRIKPVVQASGLVDIKIFQELSEQADTSSSGSSSNLGPTILNRKIETALTLNDGGSVVLAGLISKTQSNGDVGVPGMADLPVVGGLFKTRKKTNNRTELVVMIIPYVIKNNRDAVDLSERLKARMVLLDL